MNFWTTLLAHQATWFAAVIGAGQGHGWPGLLAIGLFVVWRLAVSRHRGLEARLGLLALALGWALESLWVGAGLIGYAAPAGVGAVPGAGDTRSVSGAFTAGWGGSASLAQATRAAPQSVGAQNGDLPRPAND